MQGKGCIIEWPWWRCGFWRVFPLLDVGKMPLGDGTALMLSNKIMNIFFWIYAMRLITSPLDRNEEVCFGLGYVPMMG